MIVGIDYGTTNSYVAISRNNEAFPISIQGCLRTPSIVWINPYGEYIVGMEAKRHVAVNSDHILISTKKDLGSYATYYIGDETFTPEQVASVILSFLKCQAERTLGEEVCDAVITVPACFGFKEIEILKCAAIEAGINPFAVIPASVASAIRYGIDVRSQQNICFISLGGGILDISIFKVSYNRKKGYYRITLVNCDGGCGMGGDDFDNVIIDWMLQHGAQGFNDIIELKAVAEAAKIELASLYETEVFHPVFMPCPVVLTRGTYKKLIQSKLNQIGNIIRITIANSVIDGSHINMNDINRFFLIGGSCKHSIVSDYIQEVVGKALFCVPNLDTYIAEGASLYPYMHGIVDYTI